MKSISLTAVALIVALTGGKISLMAGDWPAYRQNAFRASASSETLTVPLHLDWVYKSRKAPCPAWPPKGVLGKNSPLPTYDNCFQIVASGSRLVFGSSSENKVVCLDTADGSEVWSFLADGPVRFAPSISAGRVLFGSDDGRVRCLNLSDGSLVWERTPVQGKTWLPGNNSIIYSVPVRTDVMVLNGKGHFGAGLFPETSLSMGVWRCDLNVADGSGLNASPSTRVAEGYLAADTGSLIHWPEGKLAYTSSAGFMFADKWDGAAIRVGADSVKGTPGTVSVSGTASWSAAVIGNPYSIVFSNRRLFVGTDSGYIYCMTGDSASPADRVSPAAQAFECPGAVSAQQYASAAGSILAAAGLTQGYALVLDEAGRGGLGFSLVTISQIKVVCVVADSAAAADLRARLDRAGAHGAVTVIVCGSAALPFPDHLFNIVAHDGFASGAAYPGPFADAEIMRVLRPYGGVAFTGAGPVRKEAVAGAGEWTHAYAREDRNPNSLDPYAGHAYRLLWFGRPGPLSAMDRHTRGMMPLWKNGILVEAGEDRVTAVDAYNGTVLWEKTVPLSARTAHPFFSGHMVLQDDFLYVLSGGNCLAFLPREGTQRMSFSMPSSISGSTDQWGYLACVNDLLIGSVNRRVPGAYQGYSSWAERTVHGRHEYYVHETGQALFACDRRDAGLPAKWVYTADSGAIINPTIAVGNGKIMFLESTNPLTLLPDTCAVSLPLLLGNKKTRVVALNINDGSLAWRRTMDLSEIVFSAVMIHAQDRLFLQGTRGGISDTTWGLMAYCTYAFNSQTGDSLWKAYPRDGIQNNGHGAGLRHPAVVDGRYYILDLAGHIDIASGVVTNLSARMPGRCGTFTASATHLFGRVNTHSSTEVKPATLYDQVVLTASTRPACWSNMIPAGGLLNMPDGQHGCNCAFPLEASMAFLPTDTPLVTSRESVPFPDQTGGASLVNFPNPFNASTCIRFSIPPQGTDLGYDLSLFDSRGRLVIILARGVVGKQGLRNHRVVWNGLDGNMNSVGSGVYFHRLTYGKKTVCRALLFIR